MRKGFKTIFFLFITSAFLFSINLFTVPNNKDGPSLNLNRIFEARRSLLLNHCIKKTKNEAGNASIIRDFPPLHHLKYIQNLPADLIFCVPPKTGSSSLNNFFFANVNSADYQTWFNETKKVFRDKRVEELIERGGSNRVMVIRHPFHRLVSAFQFLFRFLVNLKPINKFVDQSAISWLAERIIRKLRPHSTDPLISFPEFVDYVLGKA